MQLWLWSLNHLQKAKDADGGKLYQGSRQGVTFPLAEKDGPQMPALADELKVLEERLNARVVDRLQHEHDPQARALLYAFPQLASFLPRQMSR